jgi:hypothetical protein
MMIMEDGGEEAVAEPSAFPVCADGSVGGGSSDDFAGGWWPPSIGISPPGAPGSPGPPGPPALPAPPIILAPTSGIDEIGSIPSATAEPVIAVSPKVRKSCRECRQSEKSIKGDRDFLICRSTSCCAGFQGYQQNLYHAPSKYCTLCLSRKYGYSAEEMEPASFTCPVCSGRAAPPIDDALGAVDGEAGQGGDVERKSAPDKAVTLCSPPCKGRGGISAPSKPRRSDRRNSGGGPGGSAGARGRGRAATARPSPPEPLGGAGGGGGAGVVKKKMRRRQSTPLAALLRVGVEVRLADGVSEGVVVGAGHGYFQVQLHGPGGRVVKQRSTNLQLKYPPPGVDMSGGVEGAQQEREGGAVAGGDDMATDDSQDALSAPRSPHSAATAATDGVSGNGGGEPMDCGVSDSRLRHALAIVTWLRAHNPSALLEAEAAVG